LYGAAENQRGGGLGKEQEAVILWFRRRGKYVVLFMQVQISFILVL
jgi:hypothetical protein